MTSPVWVRYDAARSALRDAEPDGGLLPALRRGRHASPGTEPRMLPYYTTLNEKGWVTEELRAEHICLVLFGIHQQGKSYPVHAEGVGFGQALAHLRESAKFSDKALDRRVMALLTANSLAEAARHLFTLVDQMSAAKAQIRFDYTALQRDLTRLQFEASAARVRRSWGAAYFHHSAQSTSKENTRV